MVTLRLSNDGRRELTFHVKGGRTKTRVCKNGKQLLEHKGSRMDKEAGGYVKLGMHAESNGPRTLYIDNVRIWAATEETKDILSTD